MIKNKALVYKDKVKEERAGQGEGIKRQGNTQLIIITLNVNGMNSPIKQKQKQSGLETKILQYIVYKKHT